MLVTYSSVVAILATVAVAVPLNINLGAYSPALVVGDGEISFAAGAGGVGGAAGAAGLMSTLQGASQAETGAIRQGNAIAPAKERAALLSEPASLPIPGVNKEVVKTNKVKRQNVGWGNGQWAAGFDRALRFAEVALEKGPKIQLGTPAAGVGIIVENNPISAAAPNRVVE